MLEGLTYQTGKLMNSQAKTVLVGGGRDGSFTFGSAIIPGRNAQSGASFIGRSVTIRELPSTEARAGLPSIPDVILCSVLTTCRLLANSMGSRLAAILRACTPLGQVDRPSGHGALRNPEVDGAQIPVQPASNAFVRAAVDRAGSPCALPCPARWSRSPAPSRFPRDTDWDRSRWSDL